jgi:hypothetical protein
VNEGSPLITPYPGTMYVHSSMASQDHTHSNMTQSIWKRRQEAMKRNYYTVSLSAQRTFICPHDDGRVRGPLRRQAEDSAWGWWLPHPIRRETWTFVGENLPQSILSFKYSREVGIKSKLSEPVWLQGPTGLWGWAVREEDFGSHIYSPEVPWTMYY